LLVQGLALEVQVERGPGEAVRTLGADQPGCFHLLEPAIRVAQGRCHRRGVVRERVLGEACQCDATLDRDALA